MKYGHRTFLLFLIPGVLAHSQTDRSMLAPILDQQIQSPDVTAYELRRYIISRIPRLPSPRSAEQWTAQARTLRQRLLNEIVFHGWPPEWVTSSLRVEDLGVSDSGAGYRMRKLRYEIVPGFQSTAILYEPEVIRGKVPAILNVNGHVGLPGKAIEYKQKRCISQARQGILALNLEWIGFGELSVHENEHWFGAHLDLVGANSVGLFYLAMRKGLDYLYQHPAVDQNRIGMTGLSGGGWQTIVLSALDERISAAVPVAGYSSFLSRLEHMIDVGDIEQNATDMFSFLDYAHLTAMRAPRATLLVYNAEDNCCFRAPLVKDRIFDAVLPFFRLYGAEDHLAWHENQDPADHNYQLDNRLQSYRFFARYFGLPEVRSEIPVDAEIRSVDQLSVGLPLANLTILGLAKEFAVRIPRATIPPPGAELSRWADGQRVLLKRIVRYQPARVRQAWAFTNTKRKGLESVSYRFEYENGLSSSGVWLKAFAAPDQSRPTIILNDEGRKRAASEVSDGVNRGEQVLAADLLFTGDIEVPKMPANRGFTQYLAAVGERPLGIEAAQLIGLAQWMQGLSGGRSVRLESTGIRSQVASLIAGALAPELFSELVIRNGIRSFRHLLDAPVEYQQAPDLFCLDLYRNFDLGVLERLAASANVIWRNGMRTSTGL